MDLDKVMGCSQHPFTHDGEEYLVDECVCDTPFCNKEMGPIPTTTSTEKTTTTHQGITPFTINNQWLNPNILGQTAFHKLLFYRYGLDVLLLSIYCWRMQ